MACYRATERSRCSEAKHKAENTKQKAEIRNGKSETMKFSPFCFHLSKFLLFPFPLPAFQISTFQISAFQPGSRSRSRRRPLVLVVNLVDGEGVVVDAHIVNLAVNHIPITRKHYCSDENILAI